MNWNLVPHMFSNLVGQILPGFVLIVLFSLTVLAPQGAVDALLDSDVQRRIFSVGPIVVVLFLSQAIGMLLGQLWTLTIGRLLKNTEAGIARQKMAERLKEHNDMLTGLELVPLPISAHQLPAAFVMHDHLHLSAPSEAARLLKVRAERRHCHALAAGAGLLALINILWCISEPSSGRFAWEIALLGVTVTCSLRSYRLVEFLTNGITATWLCLASGEQLGFQIASQSGNGEGPDS